MCYQHYHLFNDCFCLLDEEGVRYVPVRPRPPVTLLRHYRNPWKAAYHHFQRYSDIRVKGQYLIRQKILSVKVIANGFLFLTTILSLSHRGEEGHLTGYG